ncbi:hypothetical protein QBC46DRAFT_366924 [Diplogelasinospora grovesii]|uniref:Uncharacterized protein n=1 Tax=Diplogelasinospora grovesii TaxID=303347 RepID=A0AAN6S1E3_9PEZI|nr:hypothetical protein QBC46DRAFT_366924 [Diplogelasinospora grovesii]
MRSALYKASALLALSAVTLIKAAPFSQVIIHPNDPSLSAFGCGNPVWGLAQDDCQWMSQIGMAGMGINAGGNNGHVWVGGDGPNTITFWNRSPVRIIALLWNGDQSWVNVAAPQISWSLAPGQAVTISAANGVAGGFSALYNHQTTLRDGQVYNTWGEFSTGNSATVDISRLPNMSGSAMDARVGTGCVTNMNTCVFVCSNGQNRCGGPGEYALINCSGPNTAYGLDPNGQPGGGCQGWSNGGHIDVDFY